MTKWEPLPGLRGGSADTNGLWKNQLNRVDRWRFRVIAALRDARQGQDVNYDFVDFFLAFHINAHSLRDWFIETPAVERDVLDNLLGSYEIWPVCRDIANRARHLELTRNPRDRDWSLLRSYDPFYQVLSVAPISWKLTSRDWQFEAGESVKLVWEMWTDIIPKLNLDDNV